MWFLRRRQNKASEEAAAALADARRNLREVQSRSPEVIQVAKALREIRERNHFADNLQAIIARHGGPLNDA